MFHAGSLEYLMKKKCFQEHSSDCVHGTLLQLSPVRLDDDEEVDTEGDVWDADPAFSEDSENPKDDANDGDNQPGQGVADPLLGTYGREDEEDVDNGADNTDDLHHAQYDHSHCDLITSTVEMGEQRDEEPSNVSHLHQGQGQLYAANDESPFSKVATTAEA